MSTWNYEDIVNLHCPIVSDSMPDWIKWGFWASPVTYAEIGLSVNEFLAPRWQKVSLNPPQDLQGFMSSKLLSQFFILICRYCSQTLQ